MIASLLLEHLFPPYLPDVFHPLSGGGYQFWSGIGAGSPIVTVAMLTYKQHNCKAHWWCPLWGHHKVEGTTASVCNFHHTLADHERLFKRHKRKHPNRLAHGESHNLQKDEPSAKLDTGTVPTS